MLINIEEWKRQGISQKTTKYLIDFPQNIKWVDQDALNAVLIKNWQKLSCNYNLTFYHIPQYLPKQEFKNFLSDKVIIHYTTQNKPWIENCTNRLRYLYYYYLDKSPHSNIVSSWPKMNVQFWFRRMKRKIKEFFIDYTNIFSERQIKKAD